MMVRIVFTFTMLVSMALNTFAQVPFKYKVENNEIVFNVGASTIRYALGTKTAEYIMGYLANSNQFSNIEKKDVVYNSKTYTIVQFYNNQGGGGASFRDYRLGFLRADDGTDVIILSYYTSELERFKIGLNETPANVMKVDYVVGQIIKWMNSYTIIGTNIYQYFCISNINVTNGIPINIEFEYGTNCP